MLALRSRLSVVRTIALGVGYALLYASFTATTFGQAAAPLPGTQPLVWQGDISLRMVDDLHSFADRETAASVERRARHWQRDFSSPTAYVKSMESNRARLAKYLGFGDPAKKELRDKNEVSVEQGENYGPGFKLVHSVVAVATGFEADVYELYPDKPLRNSPTIILLPDADQTPESFIGFDENAPDERAVARRFVAAGFHVVVPRLIDRNHEHSTLVNGARKTPQPHREFIYRQAFEMGRHVIGYELDLIRILTELHGDKAVDGRITSVAIAGYGEGGLLALYAAALDPRIQVVGVSGYFGPREQLWQEPIYRNVWGLLDEFGDAELAAMIAPNQLIVEASRAPKIKIPSDGKVDVTRITPGTLTTPAIGDVKAEIARALKLTEGHPAFANQVKLVAGDAADQAPWSDAFIAELVAAYGDDKIPNPPPRPSESAFGSRHKPEHWQGRYVHQLVEQTQAFVRESEYVRKDYWKNADHAARDPEKWKASLGPYRKHLYEEVLGKIELPLLPPNARTRQIYDTPKYVGYEVVLDVFDNDPEKPEANVFAYGVLLVPKGLKSGERRPVVVCQHGLEGRPRDTIDAGGSGERYYHRFAHHLAERGFVAFSPQNPYLGKHHFRQLVRKLYPLKQTLWSVIVPQHEQITNWLASLGFVDAERIGFYGLSYGGKTAMRVPALVERYCLSICSGDFNEWIRKCTSVRDPFSYMGTTEYEMFEFDLGHTFNYAEMAYLIAPRPFMVERGHRDGVGIDEWVGYEYGKIRLLYADLKIPEQTEIEYFDGPHEIHAVGTFDFLHRHLQWPAPK
ncbi:MAG: hypothetical protein K8U03_06530 [Planctomycetia bacterium]|nr:hypothetical protein [Planctomycetia bacterium]